MIALSATACGQALVVHEDEPAKDPNAGGSSTSQRPTEENVPNEPGGGEQPATPPGNNQQTTSPKPPADRFVFVTSVSFTSSEIDGAAGAAAKCQTLAAASPLLKTRVFAAWLSDGLTTPFDRLREKNARYVRVDGAIVANNFSSLATQELLNAIQIDEHGKVQSGAVWSATSPIGMRFGPNCLGWNGSVGTGGQGVIGTTTPAWTNGSFGDCSSETARLYCFER